MQSNAAVMQESQAFVPESLYRKRRNPSDIILKVLIYTAAVITVLVLVAVSYTHLDVYKRQAMAYYKKMGIPSFAVESGLYIEGLPEEKQPAAQYRKYRGIRLSDEDCIDSVSYTHLSCLPPLKPLTKAAAAGLLSRPGKYAGSK